MKVPPIKELRKMIHKSKNDNRYIEFLRIFSIYFTKFFLYTPLSPNHVTIITFLIAIASSIFFSFGFFGIFSLFFSYFIILMRSHVFVEKKLKRDKQKIKKKKKEKEEEILKENMKEAGFIFTKKSF